jgi:HTH-type transcriptional regulator/antitoxin HigA
MKKEISKKAFEAAEAKMNELLFAANQKGGFNKLTHKEKQALEVYTKTVKKYEDDHYLIEMPNTIQDLLELKMYEKKLKQKEMASLLNTTDTKLSEILHQKRKPSLSFIKSLHHILGIDGNLLLKIA